MPAQRPFSLRDHFARQAKIYDLSRWAVLFGRRRLSRMVPLTRGARVLDVGCGTGRWLPQLADRVGPGGQVVGIDLCEPMLARARRRCRRLPNVDLRCGDWVREPVVDASRPFDAVLFSYSLSMIDEWTAALDRARAVLRPGGHLGAVDFHSARGPVAQWIRRWHVRLGSERRDGLRTDSQALVDEIHRGLGGLWQWFLYVGATARA